MNSKSSALTQEQIVRCQEIFMKFDRNSDGVIELSELKEGLKELGQFSDSDVQEIMDEVDLDKNGVIDEEEFRLYAADVFVKQEQVKVDKILTLFQKYDIDHDKLVGPDEVLCITQDLNLEVDISMSDAEKIVQFLDSDGDGKINFEELKSFLCK